MSNWSPRNIPPAHDSRPHRHGGRQGPEPGALAWGGGRRRAAAQVIRPVPWSGTVKFPMSGDTTTNETGGRLWSAAQSATTCWAGWASYFVVDERQA